MPEKSSSTGKRNYPRTPPSHSGIQVNHCKSPICTNYGVAPEQKSVRGKNRYTLDRHKGIASCICTVCGVGFPLKSNLGIVEEVERLASYLSPPDAVCCPNKDCANHANKVPIEKTSVYASFGKTTIGNPRCVAASVVKHFPRTLSPPLGKGIITRTKPFSNC